MDLARVRIGIVGGGIGGLTAAIALAARGVDVTVLERAKLRTVEGVALLLWANAVRALAGLGLDLTGIAEAIEHTEVRTAAGELLCSLPINEWSTRAGARSVVIRRPLLISTLAGAVPSGVVETGCNVVAFAREGARIRVELESGDQRMFDAVIGADGLHSAIRTQLHGKQPIRVTGQRGWVGLARPPHGLMRSGVTTATIGRGPRFWAAPLPKGEAFWFATLNRADAPAGGAREFVRAGLATWHAPITELLDTTHEDDIVQVRISDRPPIERWGEGPVTLLGDAAHAATPDLGQGACQAIESAVVLADCLAKNADIEAGLRAYERMRMDRTATISRLCWITSLNTTIESPLLCALRDAGIRFGLPAIARRHLAWIMGSAE